jgi:hypothetical protein
MKVCGLTDTTRRMKESLDETKRTVVRWIIGVNVVQFLVIADVVLVLKR